MLPPACPARFAVLTLLTTFLTGPSLVAQAPLPERIDLAIRAGAKDFDALAAPRADDAEFVRRLYLDLTGMIPSAAETRAFLADTAPDKRPKLVDRLLADARHARHMQQTFDVLLMDRRPAKHVKAAEWQEYLRASFAANKPYDQLVRELLSADGSDPKTRAAARFFLDREGEPHQITKDMSRLWLGMNLHCAQCHDHPLVESYKQDFYYGLFAFVSRSYLFKDKKGTILAEKGEGNTTFTSVFMPKVVKSTGPRLPGGAEVKEPKFAKGQEYVAPVKKGQRGIPKFSRRAQLAGAVIAPENRRFARSAVNRLWAQYLGRGLVHPIEFDHPANPPSHPALLDQLADEFRAKKCDLRALTRSIMLSQTYQRSSAAASDGKERVPTTFAVAALRPLTAEQLAWSLLQATGQLDAERKARGPKATEAALHAKFAGQAAQIVKLFGGAPGEPSSDQDFEATLDQTLFVNNGGLLRGWLAPRPGNLTDRLAKLTDAATLADELYLSVLSRRPSAEERQEVADHLRIRGTARSAAIEELAWALLASAEFRFNH